MNVCRIWVLSLLLFFNTALQSGPLSFHQVPDPLKPWVDWVLQGKEEIKCPFLYNNAEQRRCGWPTRLTLDLSRKSGHFDISWRVYIESWITLPGDKKHWPQNVEINKRPVVTLERDGKPVVRLEPGVFTIQGNFYWNRLPESLAIPEDVGLISVSVNGKAVSLPRITRNGRLLLGEKAKQKSSANTLDAQVFRRVVDDVPLRLITRINLNVAGTPREIKIGPVLPDGFIPLSVQSPIPARLEPDGSMLLQLRTGRWTLEAIARHPQELTGISLPKAGASWPRQETWVFEEKRYQRLVKVEGVSSIDPQQTNLPADWKNLPAYRLNQGDVMDFNIIRRGDPEPEPDRLSIQRNLWLDFDGGGYTISDNITGIMTQGWRLDTLAGMELGQATIDGQPRLITKLPGAEQAGVELRRGKLDLSADSRYTGSVRFLNAVGWDHDFQQVSASLHLPPGWRLFYVGGVDHERASWLQRWTLLDLFVVLIAALAVGRLFGKRWGILALVALSLIWHEPNAPRYVWLNVLAAIALLQVLPEGQGRRAVTVYRNIAMLLVILAVLPFVAQQVRVGIYPQLEFPWKNTSDGGLGIHQQPRLAEAQMDEGDMASKSAEGSRYAMAPRLMTSSYKKQIDRLQEIDPNAKIQTGPGLPAWQWRSIRLQWNGPVEKQHLLRLGLMSPNVNRLLYFLQILLVSLLSLLILGVFPWKRFKGLPPPLIRSVGAGLVFVVVSGLFSSTAEADFPDNALLKQLKERLLEPPPCIPACAEIPFARMALSADHLLVALKLNVQDNVAVPLPGQVGQWIPHRVLVNDKPAQGLFRTASGQVWLNSAKGQYWVVLNGPLPQRDTVQLSFPLMPRRVEVKGDAWLVKGMDDNGVPDGALQLSRVHAVIGNVKGSETFQPTPFPPYLQVERTLLIGLDWQVKTQVVRKSPADIPIVAEIHLLEGESVTTPGVRIKNHKVLVNLSPRRTKVTWESVLNKNPQFTMTAPVNTSWNEIWRVDVSPIWHLDSQGIPVVYDRSDRLRWLPEWRPWPGESVTLMIKRPQGVPGQTLTVDSSLLRVKPGLRSTDVALQLSLRSSQGGQHKIRMPPDVALQTVTIDGKSQPIRQQQATVTLPIHPGKQQISLTWRAPEGIHPFFRTYGADIGVASVNSRINIRPGQDRWVLFAGGPRLGPAVLYWSVLFVALLLAIGLGRLSLVPLKNWQWFLLLIGLSQISLAGGLIVVGWLLLLGIRFNFTSNFRPWLFNALQIGLALYTVVALGLLFTAVQQGLLGRPDMQIGGNNSTAYDLNWYQDHSLQVLPAAWLVSVPLLVYRLLMLVWALWLAHSLLNWLRWGWDCYAHNGIWKRWEKRKNQPDENGDQAESSVN